MSSQERNIEVKVGLLVLIAAGLFVGFVFLLGDYQTGERRQILVDFPTSADLKEGAPVKVSGVSIGKVHRVEFWGGREDTALGRRVQVRVVLDVDASMSAALHDDSRAFISTLGILGEKYVEIEPGTYERPALPASQVLEGEPPLRLELVARDLSGALTELSALLRDNRETVGSALRNLDKLLANADALLVDNREAVQTLLAKLVDSADRLNGLLATAQGAIKDGEDVREILTSLRSAAHRVDESVVPLVRRLERTLDGVQAAAGAIQNLGEDNRERVAAVLERVLGVLGEVKTVAVAIREGRGSIGALLSDQELYTRIKETIADLQRHPWKFIWKE